MIRIYNLYLAFIRVSSAEVMPPPPHHQSPKVSRNHGFITQVPLYRVQPAIVFLKLWTMAPLSALIDILSIEDIKWDLSFVLVFPFVLDEGSFKAFLMFVKIYLFVCEL